jgi:hypothetical protein
MARAGHTKYGMSSVNMTMSLEYTETEVRSLLLASMAGKEPGTYLADYGSVSMVIAPINEGVEVRWKYYYQSYQFIYSAAEWIAMPEN